VRGRLDAAGIRLWFALSVWIAGFDLIYAGQDVVFDRAHGLQSCPRASASRWCFARADLPRADGGGLALLGAMLALVPSTGSAGCGGGAARCTSTRS